MAVLSREKLLAVFDFKNLAIRQLKSQKLHPATENKQVPEPDRSAFRSWIILNIAEHCQF